MNMLELLQFEGLTDVVTSEICGVLALLSAKLTSSVSAALTEILL